MTSTKAADRRRIKHMRRIDALQDPRARLFYAWSWVLSLVRRDPILAQRATAAVLDLAEDLHERTRP